MSILFMLLWGIGISSFSLALSGFSRSLIQVSGKPLLLCGGDQDDRLGLFPELILATVIFTINVGFGAVFLIEWGFLGEEALRSRISLGGVLGIVYFALRGHDRVRQFFQTKGRLRQLILGLVAGIAGGLLGFLLGNFDDMMLPFEVRLVTAILAGLMCGYLGGGISYEIYERKWGTLYVRLSVIAACPMLFVILSDLGHKTLESQRIILEGLVLGMACLTACICEYLCRVPAIKGAERLAGAFTPFLSLLHYHTILCSHCLRHTSPFQSRYANGKRYCEHCTEPVEPTAIPGHVILTFGAFSRAELQEIEDGRQRVFLRENPIFGTIPANPETGIFLSSTHASEHGKQPIDVSEVYLDTRTCVSGHIERFITYVVNHPPKDGIQSIRIFHRGQLEYLGKALANALYNNFPQIQEMH